MSDTSTRPSVRHWWRQLLSGRPHQIITNDVGVPYLERWYVFPKNRWFKVYVHRFLRSDEDRALHDHPWDFVSVILRGRYIEHREQGSTLRLPFSVAYRPAETRHRVQLYRNLVTGIEDPCLTLIVTGPKVREWGFWCAERFVHWRQWGPRGCGEVDL